MTPLTLLIADDHRLVRAGFRALVEGIPGVTVVAEARNGLEAWDLICSLRPAIALVDISMPLLNGLELTTRVTAKQLPTVVIVLTMHESDEFVQRAVRAGAAGYLKKDVSPTDLERAIRTVNRGETYYHPSTPDGGGRLPPGKRQDFARFDSLTARQREILQLIGEGYSTKLIANLLRISIKTAEAHRTRLMARLELHDVAAVVRYAVAVGLVDPET